ncbi:MAG: glycoside hydrolase family 28 protein, partial [Firmicutes bacterium]|nr:glycoside hydrolase family 28 protein [Bacillota bacterium]
MERLNFEVLLPEFKAVDYVITSYGAVGDGRTKNTEAFAKAIADCNANGGGRVVVPAGMWLTGPIELKSNIDLHLEKGAVIMFSADFDDYPLINTSFEGFFTYRCISPIYAKELENVAVTGEGVIDGSGGAWRPVKHFKLPERQWDSLVKSGGSVQQGKEEIWWPTEAAMQGNLTLVPDPARLRNKAECEKYRDFLRPAMVNFTNCKKVLLDGVTFQNSPAWNLHPWCCEHVTIRNVNVRNPWFSQNGDGLDVDSCKYVKVYDSVFDVGDDALCIKSGKNEDGRKLGKVCRYVEFKNCTVYHGHGGFVIGSVMSGGVKDIQITDCTFIGTDTGLRFKSCLGRGGVVEDIYIDGVNMTEIPKEAIIFTMGYDMDTKEGQQVAPEEIPEFKNITIKNVNCAKAGTPISISGLSAMPVHDIRLENINIASAKEVKTENAENI